MTTEFTTRDLIELSLLDAMGLLDDDERAAFERAFAGTSPAVQSHIRREQTRLAQIDFLLPDVEAPAGLRAMVLEAVRKAMSEGGVEKEAAGSAFMHAMIPSRRVSPLWRAGAVGFATAAVVLGFMTVKLRYDYDYLEQMRANNDFQDQTLRSLGPSYQESFFNANIRHIMFKPTSAEVRGEAMLLLNTETRQATLVCQKLPMAEGQDYHLVKLNDDGSVGESIAPFTSMGLTSKPLKVQLVRGQRLGIVPPSEPGKAPASPILVIEPLAV